MRSVIADIKLCVLMSCHNRRDMTVRCLKALFANSTDSVQMTVLLVDDASTDGTASMVSERFPEVKIIKGDGNLFWNRGMLLAWKNALSFDPDFVLWLNDDTLLDAHAIQAVLSTHGELRRSAGQGGIVVGSTTDEKGALSYGGWLQSSLLYPMRFSRVVPGAAPAPCHTMNGNCVLVARSVVEKIGLLDECFIHGMGDFDFGLRATKAGIAIWLAPGIVGRCTNDNATVGSYRDATLPFPERWKKMLSVKGLPPGQWKVLCRRHAGPAWFLYWLWPYFKLALSSVVPRSRFSLYQRPQSPR